MIRFALPAALVLALAGLAGLAHGADTPLAFEDAAAQARYDALLAELRCLVCQNQSLADSHAELADDLRREVHRMISAGRSDAEIRDFMVGRYGDFVLYEPPVKASTVLLWLGPMALAITGLGIVVRMARLERAAAPALDDAERARLDKLLHERSPDDT